MSELTDVTRRQILRGRILELCFEAGGASVQLLRAALKKEGYGASETEVIRECDYLKGKGLVRVDSFSSSVLGINRVITKVEPRGIDVLEGTLEIDGVELV